MYAKLDAKTIRIADCRKQIRMWERHADECLATNDTEGRAIALDYAAWYRNEIDRLRG